MSRGTDYAEGAIQRIGSRLSEERGKGTLAELIEQLPDGDGVTKVDLHTAVAYLAAQVWAGRNVTGAARTQDALHVIAMLERQVDWWREREQTREAT